MVRYTAAAAALLLSTTAHATEIGIDGRGMLVNESGRKLFSKVGLNRLRSF